MKKKHLLITVFSLSTFFSNVQSQVQYPPKEKLNKTKIELLYSHYIQEGEHSAITGGIGTEELTVYAPKIKVSTTFKERNTLFLDAGVDIITSVSTDKIDFAVSSSSIVDARNFATIGYSRQRPKRDAQWTVSSGYSFESDYLSIPFQLGYSLGSKDKMRDYSVQIQTFFDDLRWGRLHPDFKEPTRLIYPQELRNTEWFDIYKRTAFNFKLGLTQIINKRNIIGFYPELGYQEGLLSTPFHRVYFNDGTLRVENLPQRKLKGSLAVKWNSFVGDRIVLKNKANIYKDDFGVMALALEHTSAIKLNSPITIAPFFKLFFQKGTPYFAPWRGHATDEVYYTSDYDLSSFQTYTLGLNLRHAPQRYIRKQFLFHEMQVRYSFSYRTDGLSGHIISISFSGTKFEKNKKTNSSD